MSALQSFFRQLLTVDFSWLRLKIEERPKRTQYFLEIDLKTKFLIEDALTEILSLSNEQIQYHSNRLGLIGQNLINISNACMVSALAATIDKADSLDKFIDKNINNNFLFIPINVPDDGTMQLSFEDYYYLSGVFINTFSLASNLRFKIEQFTNIKVYFNSKKANITRRKFEEEFERISPNILNCMLSVEQVSKLYNSLKDKEYIVRTTTEITFKEVFFGLEKFKNPIKWIPKIELFTYLFYQMDKRKMFNKSTWKSLLENRNLFISEEGNLITAQTIQLANGRNKKKEDGKPKDSEAIDLILDELKFVSK